MSDPRPSDEIERMWQEAEVYESQGLYDHAVLVYQNILIREPDNKRAQAKVVQIQFTQKIEEASSNRQAVTDDFSPRLAIDLGLAYMGMKLYREALEEFQKALEGATGSDRFEMRRYTVGCLLRVRRFEEAKDIIDALLADGSITDEQKGDFVEEMVGACIEEGLMPEARDLLVSVPEELRAFISDYDLVVDEVASAGHGNKDYEILLEDTKTGEFYRTERQSPSGPLEEDTTTTGRRATRVLESSIPLNAVVAYSFDNKAWHQGTALRLSAGGALLKLPDPVAVGDSIVLKLHLPQQSGSEPVWVVSRIARSDSSDIKEDPFATRAQFVSFLPGGETILKNFIDEVVKNPAILAETPEPPESPEPPPPSEPTEDRGDVRRQRSAEDVFAELQAEAVKVMETQLLGEAEQPHPRREDLPTREVAKPATLPPPERRHLPRIRFACQCGQVHIVPAQQVGRKGTCGGCGEIITVPVVDPRQDTLSEQVIGKVVGGCRLLYKIGGGGMGGVFKAHHLALDIPVAVKLLHAHLAEKDPVFIRRFIREARSAAKLQHPHVVGVMNVGFEKGVHYLVMPYVTGGSAAALLTKIGKLPLAKVLQIGIQISKALNVAEEHTMLHRDIKPANILFNARGEAMLADLGLAKHYLETQDAGITQTGITCGTPLYFSPEQAKGSQHLDIRSDIYSLGITLYHLLTGSPPFIGESAYVIFQKHVHDPLPPFKDTDIPMAEEVFQVLGKMTTKKPEDRYQNSHELLDALEELRNEVAERTRPATPSRPKRGLLERLGIKKSG
jgi:tetratricopeptide (TPR) repeat protein